MENLTQRFQDLFNTVKFKETVRVTLDIHDIGSILAALKSTDIYANEVDSLMKKTFQKARESNELQ